MDEHGFFRVAAASPRVSVGNPAANAAAILEMVKQAADQKVELIVFPELSLTGYTCGDLFADETLLRGAAEALHSLALDVAQFFPGVMIVGLPIKRRSHLFNCAAVVQKGSIAGLVPKRFIPNYKEFYERRWFTPGPAPFRKYVHFGEFTNINLQSDDLFAIYEDNEVAKATSAILGVEICEDLWVPVPPSSELALRGANIIVNLSASNEVITKADYRRDLVVGQSARLMSAYIYAGASVTESTTDLVFGGHCLIAENGALLAESKRFHRDGALIVADIDIERLNGDRRRSGTFGDQSAERITEYTKKQRITELLQESGLSASLHPPHETLLRPISPHPFVPRESQRLADRCEEIFHIQTAALAKRIEVSKQRSLHIGVSGGLDSTLSLLVATKTCDLLGLPRETVHGLTMPGFGTSSRTKTNAIALMEHLGIASETIDIRQLCLDTFISLGHKPFGIDPTGMDLDSFVAALTQVPIEQRSDLTFENVQARVRTLLLMNRGFVVGTGDMSELALGWATYNADHMSMYNPNAGVPKTLVRFLVEWAADHEFEGPARDVLHSIARTEISPELLPLGEGESLQSTEGTIGPYELHDFFLYYVLRFGFRPSKIYRLARQAIFSRPYTPVEVRTWMRVFYRRFFANQFKRSCVPDGPKVGSVSLSPRGDWRMPSDADASLWLAEVDGLCD
jgi:NAD+ synthase (glutamine-hydrolysing)